MSDLARYNGDASVPHNRRGYPCRHVVVVVASEVGEGLRQIPARSETFLNLKSHLLVIAIIGWKSLPGLNMPSFALLFTMSVSPSDNSR